MGLQAGMTFSLDETELFYWLVGAHAGILSLVLIFRFVNVGIA